MPQTIHAFQNAVGNASRNRDLHQLLAWAVSVLGPLSAISLFWTGAHVFSTATGLAAVSIGAVSQILADNRSEEWESVVGVLAGAVGLFIGAGHGGFG